MDIETAKKYFPKGNTHITDTKFSDRELAKLVDMMFFKNTEQHFDSEEEEAVNFLMKKEVAYQVIRRLAGEEEIQGVIQNEMDWMWYFQLGNPDRISEKQQWIEYISDNKKNRSDFRNRSIPKEKNRL